MRLFVAIPVDGKIRECATRLRKANEFRQGLRWTPMDQLHITALFLGECPGRDFSSICQAMASVCDQHKPFTLEQGQFVTAPRGHDAKKRMIWLHFAQHTALTALHNELVAGLKPVVPTTLTPVETMEPHITTARLRRGAAFPKVDLQVLKKPVYVEARNVWLVQSRLGARGAVYRWLQCFSLDG